MTTAHSDKLYPAALGTHLQWMWGDLERGELYGIPESLFFKPQANDPFRLERYGRVLETPIGVAAGPQTQLAQNIVAAWLCGARYVELKTVQVLDELEVTKPCIDMADEGYNCEWSQELKLDQSFDEYLKAFVLIYILKDKLGLRQTGEAGFIFNMSAGYNLEGLRSPGVQRFFDRMSHCPAELAQKIEEAAAFYPRVRELNIPAQLSDNLTVSTMHGCPPEEVEKIGSYFIQERGFHTTVKLNPTLLGPEALRGILNGKLGYQTEVPDEAFGHDLKYPDGVRLIANLEQQARARGVAFSLKLTNTLETRNQRQNLPKSEGMVYMSGRALHPVSVNLAARLQQEFGGRLDISFSAGADYLNITPLIAAGLAPVTVSSDALRPGGYGRLSQYLETLGQAMREAGATSINAMKTPEGGLASYAVEVLEDPRYKKAAYPYKNGVKTSRALNRFNCAAAPCVTTCPASQDVPRYLGYTARGEYEKAYQTILATNPFPNTQGAVCDHQCQFKCTRLNYDAPLKIREIKRFIAERHPGERLASPPANGLSAAVIGAGPGGLSAAYYLALQGWAVEIFEAKDKAGGMAAGAIPAFRLSDAALKKDIDRILSLGIALHLNHAVDAAEFTRLREKFDSVYLAVGAQAATRLNIPGEEAAGVMDQLTFLGRVRRGEKVDLGNRVLVLGAGNSAMDAARTARRLGAEVCLVYRRTRREMPADPDEIREALEEGVQLLELAAPEKVLVKDGLAVGLLAAKMALGEPDASGRARPVKIPGSEFEIAADSVIVAVGQEPRLELWPESRLEMDPDTGATQLAGVYTGGDAGRGAASLIQAIGDGRRAAEAMTQAAGKSVSLPQPPVDGPLPDIAELRRRQARRGFGPEAAQTLSEAEAREEAARCLRCDTVCTICVTVCPNRANLALPGKKLVQPLQRAVAAGNGLRIETEGRVSIDQAFQVVNIGDFCNECGNCVAFCPTSGAPYKDKFRVHLSRESFENNADGAYFASADLLKIRRGGQQSALKITGPVLQYESGEVRAELDPHSFEALSATLPVGRAEASLAPAAEAAVLWALVKDHPLLKA